ncbi:uncharacterized protein PHACADRAFT_120708 [Phanerochaete carnosa HHB-10118-sp]|uniref:Translation initiation factor eIF2B subunit epsilon n=1 Tax=Phanerochaete carnosa (strain HHB-10118-sp) TaxID=650164 RepID=K5W8T9_PHACS|nr:uncharacterized protein PHACADRAFT_120708 [Phanerochaete carnosa HHB-10118-sp]EKM55374.1 hypothetical protein PHACADRAFT_120708 [Phanerochaete carnosa HHB-10118-sp]
MPPKSSASKDKNLAGEEDDLQAVILADSFNTRFRPLTLGKPRCLLPVCNATLLDWTFESLVLAGVHEIFVICRSYPEQVKSAIQASKWSEPTAGIKIVPIITSKETFTPGDAMRDIYTHGIIKSDFVLVMGDLVSNVRIDEVVRIHRERRRVNKDAIMTMVVKESGAVHRTRSRADYGVFVLDSQTSQCLHYEAAVGYPPTRRVRIPRDVLAEHPEVEIRNDLIDCCIDVCSVEVPSLFQDNFDYGDIRRDFVHGVLTSDLLMKDIYCCVIKEGYASRVSDTRSYDSVSKDILSRWTFPLVPDDNHPGGHAYEYLRGNTYIAKDNSVVLSRTCKVNANTLIGAHTTVSPGAVITASVIGQRCTIGPNVTLSRAYVFDDTHIDADTAVEQSIIGRGVRIGEGSNIERGCLVGDGVILGKGARLRSFERVSRRRGDTEDEESDEEWEEVEKSTLLCLHHCSLRADICLSGQGDNTAILGQGSKAIVWPRGPSDDDEELEEVERFNNQRLIRIGDTAADLFAQAEADESDSSEDEGEESDVSSFAPLSRTSSFSSVSNVATATQSSIAALSTAAAESEFQAEVTQSLDRAFAEGHSVENAAVELKTLRMASNVDLRKVREAVVAAIVERIPAEGELAVQRRETVRLVERWGPLINQIGGVDPVETVEILQYHCAKSPRIQIFGPVLAALYQDDIVDEDDIREWHVSPAAKGEGVKSTSVLEGVRYCWVVGQKLIEQFDAQESEEESEEGDEE